MLTSDRASALSIRAGKCKLRSGQPVSTQTAIGMSWCTFGLVVLSLVSRTIYVAADLTLAHDHYVPDHYHSSDTAYQKVQMFSLDPSSHGACSSAQHC